jgi:hypothetical protein
MPIDLSLNYEFNISHINSCLGSILTHLPYQIKQNSEKGVILNRSKRQSYAVELLI